METDDAADWIGDLPTKELQEKALQGLEEEDREDVAGLLLWPEDSAGGIMQVERAQVHEDMTLIETVSKVRELVEDDLEVLSIWVVDKDEKLVGEIPIVDLLLQRLHPGSRHLRACRGIGRSTRRSRDRRTDLSKI